MWHEKHFKNKPNYIWRRKGLRTRATKAEQRLWYFIRKKQIDFVFRRQFQIERYIVDFYCNELKLIIEVDGSIHQLPATKEHDVRRQKFLESLGYTVVRYTNAQVLHEIDAVLYHIQKVCSVLKSQLR